jgi:hypothetical protein
MLEGNGPAYLLLLVRRKYSPTLPVVEDDLRATFDFTT